MDRYSQPHSPLPSPRPARYVAVECVRGSYLSNSKIIASWNGGELAWLRVPVTNSRQCDTKHFLDSVERPPEVRLDLETESKRAYKRVKSLDLDRRDIHGDRPPPLQKLSRSRRTDTECNSQGSRVSGRWIFQRRDTHRIHRLVAHRCSRIGRQRFEGALSALNNQGAALCPGDNGRTALRASFVLHASFFVNL